MRGEQQYSTDIAASVQQCFSTIVDFERYPEWFSGIEHAAILTRHSNGLGKDVEFRINMVFKTVRYVLRYEYDKPTALRWHSVDGDIESIEGNYLLEKLTPHSTRATCRQTISLGFWLPGPVRRIAEQSALRQSVLEFKAAAEATMRTAAKRSARTQT